MLKTQDEAPGGEIWVDEGKGNGLKFSILLTLNSESQ